MAEWSYDKLAFTGHAVRQMFARRLTTDAVRSVIDHGEAIAAYPDDRPYPSELVLGFVEGQPIHVVFAYNQRQRTGYVITAYRPDPALWGAAFRTRK